MGASTCPVVLPGPLSALISPLPHPCVGTPHASEGSTHYECVHMCGVMAAALFLMCACKYAHKHARQGDRLWAFVVPVTLSDFFRETMRPAAAFAMTSGLFCFLASVHAGSWVLKPNRLTGDLLSSTPPHPTVVCKSQVMIRSLLFFFFNQHRGMWGVIYVCAPLFASLLHRILPLFGSSELHSGHVLLPAPVPVHILSHAGLSASWICAGVFGTGEGASLADHVEVHCWGHVFG